MAKKAKLRTSPQLSLLLGEEDSLRSHLAAEVYSAVRSPRWTLRQLAQTLSGRDALVRVDNNVMRVPVDMFWAFRDGEYYERNVTYWLGRLVSSSKRGVIYDVGANYGFYCLKLAHVASHIHAFEPVTESYRVLQGNLRRNRLSNVTAHKLAVGDASEARQMYIYTSSGNNSFIPIQFGRYHPAQVVGRESVDVVTLDSMLHEAQLEPPDVVKVDIEGGELAALRGARELIDKYRPALLIESCEALSEAAGYRRSDLLNELDQHSSYVISGLADDVNDLNAYCRAELDSVEIGHILALPKEGTRPLWK
jgi:FkbM family methyltransferase